MEVTLEVLQIELGRLRIELCTELRAEFHPELEKTQTRIIQWMVGTFGATTVVGTIIGVYASSLIIPRPLPWEAADFRLAGVGTRDETPAERRAS